MSIPSRNSTPESVARSKRTFFVTTKTSLGRTLFQAERNANLLIEVLRGCVAARRFKLHDFVVMPDHVHLLVTVERGMTIEKAMQYVKGGFSFRLKKEFGSLGAVWQRGFSEVRVQDDSAFKNFRHYIAANPLKAGLITDTELYPYCFRYLEQVKRAGSRGPSTQ